ncbi:MAG: TlpA family protein disulfide reductase [Panacagrimonas sp.]
MRQLILISVLAASAGFAGFFAYQFFSARTPQPAPVLSMPGLDGETLHLSDYRGKLVLINFWASWCTPCLAEVPLLVDMQSRYGAQGLQIIGPALDQAEPIRKMRDRLGISYPIAVGEPMVGDAMTALGDTLGALPFSVLISQHGDILMRKYGEFKPRELQTLIEKHLR